MLPRSSDSFTRSLTGPTQHRFCDEAQTIGAVLATEIERAGTWDGSPGVLSDWSFYGGRGGLLFYLVQLCRVTQSDKLRTVVVAGLSGLLNSIDVSKPSRPDWMGGVIGAIWTLCAAAHALGEMEWFEAATGLLAKLDLSETVEGELYGGLSGIIITLLAVYRQTSQEAYLERAVEASHLLLGDAVAVGSVGLNLTPRTRVLVPLLGVAHGASGLAIACSELFRETGDPVYSYAARSALEYEDSYLSDAEQTEGSWRWVDGRIHTALPELNGRSLLRQFRSDRFAGCLNLPEAHATAWCSGKSGFIAARLATLVALGHAGRWDPSRSLESDPFWHMQGPAIDDYTYCCGFGGVVETYILAGATLGEPDLIARARDIGSQCIARRLRTGSWLASWQEADGRPRNSFMRGLAGIGYLFLRLASPDIVPSPLIPSFSYLPRKRRKLASATDLRSMRRRVLIAHWDPVLSASRESKDDWTALFLESHDSQSAEEDAEGFRSFLLSTAASKVGVESSNGFDALLSACAYRRSFMARERVLLDRVLEHVLLGQPDLLAISGARVVLQRDIRWWLPSIEADLIAFHIGGGGPQIVKLRGAAKVMVLRCATRGSLTTIDQGRREEATLASVQDVGRRCLLDLMAAGVLVIDPNWLLSLPDERFEERWNSARLDDRDT